MLRFDPTVADSLLLVIDMQERFGKAIPGIAADGDCGRAAGIAIRGCGLLGVPVLFSEQYPDGLGATLAHLREAADEATVLAKTHFSCGDDPALREHLADSGRNQIVIAGIEAHICVLATVADLLTRGYHVTVLADAVASRVPEHRVHALAAMRDIGALVLPTESVLFRLQGQAGVGCFKDLSKLVR